MTLPPDITAKKILQLPFCNGTCCKAICSNLIFNLIFKIKKLVTILQWHLEQIALKLFWDCSESVSWWMSSNHLKLNLLKTELIWLHSSRRHFLKVSITYGRIVFRFWRIELFRSFIIPVKVVQNLGILLEEYMPMSAHILQVRSLCCNCLSTSSDT